MQPGCRDITLAVNPPTDVGTKCDMSRSHYMLIIHLRRRRTADVSICVYGDTTGVFFFKELWRHFRLFLCFLWQPQPRPLISQEVGRSQPWLLHVKPKLSIRHSVEERENEKIQRRQMESCNSFGEVDMTNTYPAD